MIVDQNRIRIVKVKIRTELAQARHDGRDPNGEVWHRILCNVWATTAGLTPEELQVALSEYQTPPSLLLSARATRRD
jgi:hypothetical protein